jgi:hypothetical protein
MTGRARAILMVAVTVGAVGMGVYARPAGHTAAHRVSPAATHLVEELASESTEHADEEGQDLEGAAAEAYQAHAYPGPAVTAAEKEGARNAFRAARARGSAKGDAAGASWLPQGPLRAEEPSLLSYYGGGEVLAGRTTAMAIGDSCTAGRCRLWIGAAGGGVWRTDHALSGNPDWKFVSGSLGSNAFGYLLYQDGRLWAGTGEPNVVGDSEAGEGIWYSDDGGDTWHGPIGAQYFQYRAISSIVVDGSTLYVGTTRAVRGVANTKGGNSLYPESPGYGIWKSTDGGRSFMLLDPSRVSVASGTSMFTFDSSFGSQLGVNRIALDPSDRHTIYAAAFGRGIWRSTDDGTTWTQIKPPLVDLRGNRTEFAVTPLSGGRTRMYVSEGDQGPDLEQAYSRVWRTDDARAATPDFRSLTSDDVADPGYGSYNFCATACFYDQYVYTPPGHPDMVYLGGQHQYDETPFEMFDYPGTLSNGRGLVLSTDAGASWTDMTEDASSTAKPHGLHPDHQVLLTNPSDPNQFFDGSDGGVARSDGVWADISSRCDGRDLVGSDLTRCRQLLSRVPGHIVSLNAGLNTLQFESVSVDPANPDRIQGGTQDNGTFERPGAGTPVWPQTAYGDGGQSAFDVADPKFRLHTFFNASPEVNFSGGNPRGWIWTGDVVYGVEPGAFYVPMVNDPSVSGTMYLGASHVWRTQHFGVNTTSLDPNSQSFRELDVHCNELTGDFDLDHFQCGDWTPIGPTLTSASLGDRNGEPSASNYVSAVARAPGDRSTLWAATSFGRLFISKNADAKASAVTFARLDTLAGNDPPRFISGIYVDPANANHAWIAYGGYSAAVAVAPGPTPGEANQPGHVFSVTYHPDAGTATWTDLDGDMGDIPVNGIVRDDETGTLYVCNDFGVLKSAADGGQWTIAGSGMPVVATAGLTMAAGARRLYAATHGMGIWSLALTKP